MQLHTWVVYCQAQDYFPWSGKNFIKVWWRFSVAHSKSVCNHDDQLFTICAGKSLIFWPKRENLFWKLAVRQPYAISENMRDAKRREDMELIHRECQINTICHLVIVCLAQVSASVPRDKNTNQTLGEMCTNSNVSKWKIWISYNSGCQNTTIFHLSIVCLAFRMLNWILTKQAWLWSP